MAAVATVLERTDGSVLHRACADAEQALGLIRSLVDQKDRLVLCGDTLNTAPPGPVATGLPA